MINKNILVVGGANIEYILKSKTDIVQGSKNFVDIEELFGGSGVNYTLRLLGYNESVFPLLFLGDDSTGRQIHTQILTFESTKKDPFFDEKSFFVPSLTTPRSMIVVEGIHRTILSQDSNEKNIFFDFIKKRIKQIPDIGTVIIGHLHSDRKAINKDTSRLSTLFILDHFQHRSDTLVYANFGVTQLEYGFSFWKHHLHKIDILQLNIQELTQFLSNGTPCTLRCLIDHIRTLNIHMIITLDKLGALGIMKDEPDTLFMARPVKDVEGFLDSTGAGDAFCAGMVSKLKGRKHFTKEAFKTAMQQGRSWATYACKSYGGANNCPSKETIDTYHDTYTQDNEVLLYHDKAMTDIIALIDSMLKM